MEVWLWTAVTLLLCAVAALAGKVLLMRAAARALARDFAQRLDTDTNTLLDLPCRDGAMRELADGLNAQLRQLRDLRRRFQRGDLELKEAVTNLSHDLRTPLTAICGYLELLRREDVTPQIRRYLSQVEGRVEAMKELTQELFRYSVTASLPGADCEPVDLRGALEESLLSFYGAFRQRGIQPQVALPEGPVVRLLDRGSLNRVLSNLIGNALKYSGGDLQVSLEKTGALSFSNTAPGLDTVSAGRLFDRFYTVEAGRHATGLGLSIAKLLTERMGGTIRARFRDGRLTIALTFPEARP